MPGDYVDVDADVLGSPAVGTWYHMVTYYNAATDIAGIVVNAGTPNEASYSLGSNDNISPFTIGASGNPDFYLNGKIQGIGVYKNRVLSSSEISDIYNSNNGKQWPFIPT